MKLLRLGQPVLALLRALVLYRSTKKVDFSFGWFSLFIGLQVGMFFAIGYFVLAWVAPHVLAAQVGAGWWRYMLCFGCVHLTLAFFEFFFHRYVLHSVFWRFLRGLARKHRKHHGLTHVVELKTAATQSDRVKVRNCYPIVEPPQIESSAFPAYALVTFWGVFTPLIVTLQLLGPEMPWLISGYLAVAWSLWLYETMHAIEHLDYQKVWRPLIERPGFFGRCARKAYGFHLMHHAKDRVNQAISGFFGLPVPDWVFGTFFVPRELPLPNTEVDPLTQIPPRPLFVIRWLDTVIEACERRIQEADKLRLKQQIRS
jgi:hemolysin III